MSILEIFFILFIMLIPPSIIILFINDKREIIEKFKKATGYDPNSKNK